MKIIELIKVLFFGIIEGITEWLPISSTGHMILLDELVKLDVTQKFWDMFLVVIQLGAILAVVVLYFDKLNPFTKKKDSTERTDTLKLWLKVAIASMPAAIIGLALDDWIDSHFYNYITVAIMLILYGVIFIFIERKNSSTIKIEHYNQISYKTALLIGIFQVLALIPGTSRSGATIVGAMLLGVSRVTAAEFSFFLAIPVMFGASTYKLMKFGIKFTSSELIILILGMVTAFAVSIATIRLLLGYIKKHSFKVFGYYRIILGVIVVLYFIFLG